MSEVPFPQADKLEKILLLVRNIKTLSKNDIMRQLNLGTERQLQYYISAAIYLGFIAPSGNKKQLTESGKRFIKSQTIFLRRGLF